MLSSPTGKRRHPVYGNWQDKAIVVICMLTNQVYPPWRPCHSRRFSSIYIFGEDYRKLIECSQGRPWDSARVAHASSLSIASLNSCAFCSGKESFVHIPQRDSDEAAYL